MCADRRRALVLLPIVPLNTSEKFRQKEKGKVKVKVTTEQSMKAQRGLEV